MNGNASSTGLVVGAARAIRDVYRAPVRLGLLLVVAPLVWSIPSSLVDHLVRRVVPLDFIGALAWSMIMESGMVRVALVTARGRKAGLGDLARGMLRGPEFFVATMLPFVSYLPYYLAKRSHIPHAVLDVLDVVSGVKALAAGGEHTCAIMADNSMECWGDNQHSQLGYGGTAPIATSPQPVSSALKFVAVACGSIHTCALSSSSGVFCWGANDYGQLGDGTITQRPLPTQVAGPILSGAGTLGSSGGFTCYLSQAGDASCWGSTFSGILIVPTYAINDVKKIAVGSMYACTLEDGAFNAYDAGLIECWGDNAYGQLGDGTTTSRTTHAPVTWP